MKTAHKHLWNVAALLVIFSMLLSATFVFSASPVLAQKEPPQEPLTDDELPLDDPAMDVVGQAEPETGALISAAEQNGTAGVIVVLKAAETEKPAEVFAAAQDAFLQSMAGHNLQNVHRYQNFPLMAMQADAAAVQAMLKNPLVEAVQEDNKNYIDLAESTQIVGAVEAATAGYNGSGMTVAIIDTGVDKTHPFLGGRVVSEACFSGVNGWSSSLCPNHLTSMIGSGAGVNCTGLDGCYHGTHVAGIAAGNGASFTGVASNANIIAIQVFSDYYESGQHYLLTFDSDYIAALDHVYSLRTTYNISSVNMSLGGGRYYRYCDNARPAVKKAIDRLRYVNIATIISSGNNGYLNSMSAPGCISTAVSVGSTDKWDDVSYYSNSVSFLSLLAPGEDIYSSMPGGTFGTLSGTSMAAPHVTGAWAVLRQAFPTKTVSSILSLLKTTGVSVRDYRNRIVKRRISVSGALARYLKPTTAPGLVSPATGTNLTDGTPVLTWEKLPLVTKYKVTIKKNGITTVYSSLQKASTVCWYGGDTCTLHVPKTLTVGSFTWTIQPYSGAGGGPISAVWTFNTPATPPNGVTQVFPTGSIGYYSPYFEWTEVGTPTADKYILKLYRGNTRILTRSYQAINICASGTCKVPKLLKLIEGDYRWEILPWNYAGYGPTASATFDYHIANGYDNHFDENVAGITPLYPMPSWWWLEGSNLVTWYGNDWTWASARIDATYKDVDVTAIMNRDGHPNFSQGIFLRGTPAFVSGKLWKNGYYFTYTNDGSYSAWKVYYGRWYPLQEWAFTSAIVQGGTNTLRAYAIGTNLGFYINGTLVWSGTDMLYGPDLTSGSVGIGSYIGEWSDYYDYLYVDRITVTVPVALGVDTVSPEQLAINEAANTNPTGSIFGTNISDSDVEFYQSVPELNQMTQEQKIQACKAAGVEKCPQIFPH